VIMPTNGDGPMRHSYAFEEGGADQKALLGGKGANLAEMTALGLNVPPGFILTTEACLAYLEKGDLPDGLLAEVDDRLRDLEQAVGQRFGDPGGPLLLSVRSGAPVSMPGMMDTILNLGLNDHTVEGLSKASGDRRFAFDAYRRLVQMYGAVVLGVGAEHFEAALQDCLRSAGVDDEAALSADDLTKLVASFEQIVQDETGEPLPDDPRDQLERAIRAVFESWNTPRARRYRKLEGIAEDLGTAVNVQAMVFGNLGDDSATGVAFTRNPSTGEPQAYGDWLPNAQGEDVVAGIRVTQDLPRLADRFPDAHTELSAVLDRLESHYREMQDVEFTIERGKLWILQTRTGKRTARAAVRIAVDMVDEGLIDEAEAVRRIDPGQLDRLLHAQFDPDETYEVLTTGLAASPGAATGAVVFTADEAEERGSAGEHVILVRPHTSPDDVHGMAAAQGVLTSRGGLVSHAAVVARGMGKPAVCGADQLQIDLDAGTFEVGDTVVSERDVISIDGGTGAVVLGEVPVVDPRPDEHLERMLGWADRFRRLRVRANADTADDAARAREFGAEGIGLCRTEHMFLDDRLPLIQRVILAADTGEERRAIDALAEVQRGDFVALLEAMDGLPVTVRLLDPPLHEFLPPLDELLVRDARGQLDDDERRLLDAAESWQEDNPMLGTRGARLGVVKPELYRMQVRALMDAAVERVRAGGDPRVEIMIPLTVTAPELELLAAWVRETADEVLAAAGVDIGYHVGTMIETPRAALRAEELARTASFFSIGSNDLTQLVFAFSRDDVEARLMEPYLERQLLPANPFNTIDVDGVGELVRLAVERGRAGRQDLAIGVCGEHGGEPASIRFFHAVGVDYVSCSPFRVPVARLAAARAALADTAAGK
jgi:pyruvate, orthophosphate dikinase